MEKYQNTATLIAMWSTPRSLSTALMRSGNWQYEGSEEILAKYETDWKKVISSLFMPLPDGKTIFYQKHMALHTAYDEISLDWIDDLNNCFLIRNPRAVVSSYLKKWPNISY